MIPAQTANGFGWAQPGSSAELKLLEGVSTARVYADSEDLGGRAIFQSVFRPISQERRCPRL